MSLLADYQYKRLMLKTLSIALVLTLILWTTQSVRFIDAVIGHGFSFWTFIYFILLLIPFFLTALLPIVYFIAVVSTFSNLESSRELTIMKTAGLSPVQMARPILLLAVVLMAITYILNFQLMPDSYKAFKRLEHTLSGGAIAAFIKPATFTPITKGLTLHVLEYEKGTMKGIFINDTRDTQRRSSLSAQRGEVIKQKDDTYLVLYKGLRKEYDAKGERFNALKFERYTMKFDALKGKLKSPKPSLGERRYRDLFHPMDARTETFRRELLAEGHYRLIMPLLFLCFSLIALVTFLKTRFTRLNNRRKIVNASLLVALITVLAVSFKNLSVQTPVFLPLMYAVIILPTLIAGYLLVKPAGSAKNVREQ